MEVQELSNQIRQALKEAAVNGDRSKEDLLAVAKLARGLPTGIVDRAFAEAIETFSLHDSNSDFYQEILIAVEQFSDKVGPDRFASASRLAVHRLIADLGNPARDGARERALVRARYFALARGVCQRRSCWRSERNSFQRSMKRSTRTFGRHDTKVVNLPDIMG